MNLNRFFELRDDCQIFTNVRDYKVKKCPENRKKNIYILDVNEIKTGDLSYKKILCELEYTLKSYGSDLFD